MSNATQDHHLHTEGSDMTRKTKMTFRVILGAHRDKALDGGVVHITVAAESVEEGRKLVRPLLDEHYAGFPRTVPDYPEWLDATLDSHA